MDFNPFGSPTPPAPPAPPTGVPSPFERTFNPDNDGTLTGLIGRMSGNPTNAERLSAVDAGILQKLSGYYASNGGDQQRSILSLLNDPVGHDLMSRPGAADTLERWTKSVQPTTAMVPPGNAPLTTKLGNQTMGAPNATEATQSYNAGNPTPVNTPAETNTSIIQKQPNGQAGVTQTISGPPRVVTPGPGSHAGAIGPDGNPVGSGFANPTTPAQNWSFFSPMFQKGMTEEALGTLAKFQMPNADLAQKTASVQQLVADGSITQDYATKYLADQIMIMPGFNAAGEPTHTFSTYDKTTGKLIPFQKNPSANAGDQSVVIPSSTPGGSPTVFPPNSTRLPDGSYDVEAVVAADPVKNMFLATGIGNHLVMYGGQLIRSTVDPRNPELSSKLSAIRNDKVDIFQTAVAQLASYTKSRTNLQIEKWLADTPSRFTDPVDAYQQAIIFRNRLETMYNQNDGYVNPQRGGGITSYSSQLVKEKMDQNAAIHNVLSTMPTQGEMRDMITKIHVMPGTAMSLQGAVKGVGGLIGGMATDAVGGSSGDGAGVRAQRIRDRNATQANPEQQPTAAPTVEAIGKMDGPTLAATLKNLPNGAPEVDAVIERIKALKAGKKPTTGQGNPPAEGQSNYDLQPANPNGKDATPPLEDWLKNPSGERNVRFQQPGETIQGAKYGSDGNWHVQQPDGKWVTIVPPTKPKRPTATIGSIQ